MREGKFSVYAKNLWHAMYFAIFDEQSNMTEL